MLHHSNTFLYCFYLLKVVKGNVTVRLVGELLGPQVHMVIQVLQVYLELQDLMETQDSREMMAQEAHKLG